MDNYSAKLTGEPFLFYETKILGEYISKGMSSSEVKKKNIDENLIKYSKPASILRVNSPIIRRLEILNKELLDCFVEDDLETSKLILLYAIMKTDRLVREFVFDLYKDKLVMKEGTITKAEIDFWFDSKIRCSDVLQSISYSTETKLKQVLMKIMQDSGLVKKEKTIFKIVRPLLKEKYIMMLDRLYDIDYAKAIGGLI